MAQDVMAQDVPTRQRIKEILIDSLKLEDMTPEMIGDDMPLWGGGLGLDSVDALELMVDLEQAYGIRIDDAELDQEAFATVAHLERFVHRLVAGKPAAASANDGAEGLG